MAPGCQFDQINGQPPFFRGDFVPGGERNCKVNASFIGLQVSLLCSRFTLT